MSGSKTRRRTVEQLREFFVVAYCGLVLRGHDRERDVRDPILKEVWRIGKHENDLRLRAAKRRAT